MVPQPTATNTIRSDVTKSTVRFSKPEEKEEEAGGGHCAALSAALTQSQAASKQEELRQPSSSSGSVAHIVSARIDLVLSSP
jgi:hypothetical protein